MTELNLPLNDSSEPVHVSQLRICLFFFCLQRQWEERPGPVDTELMMLKNYQPMRFMQLVSLLLPNSASVKQSKGAHSGEAPGACLVQNNQVVPDWDWLESDKREEVKERCVCMFMGDECPTHTHTHIHRVWTQNYVPTSNNCVWNIRRHMTISTILSNMESNILSVVQSHSHSRQKEKRNCDIGKLNCFFSCLFFLHRVHQHI